MREVLVYLIICGVALGFSLYAMFEFFIRSSPKSISTSNSSGNGGKQSEKPDCPHKNK